MTTQVTFNPTSRNEILSGINTLCNAVKSTLGAKGRLVMIESAFNRDPIITKDGVTVASKITLTNPIQRLAANAAKQAAEASAKNSGDGTTTTLVILQALLSEMHNSINQGYSATTVTNDVRLDVANIRKLLKTKAKPVTDDNLKAIAIISANNDIDLGTLIFDAFQKTNKSGIIDVVPNTNPNNELEIIDGLTYDKGYVSPYFINNEKRQTVEFENPLILTVGHKLRMDTEVVPALKLAYEAKRPLLIITPEIEGSALSNLLVNRMQNKIEVAVTRAPRFGPVQQEFLLDIAVATDATLYNAEFGNSPTSNNLTIEDFGTARRVVIDGASTTIIEPNHNKRNPIRLKERVESLTNKLEGEGDKLDEWQVTTLRDRISKLTASAAIIKVGHRTAQELREKKDRIDDALSAVKSSLKEGYLPGGGVALYRASKYANTKALKTALQAPIKTILENAGEDVNQILNQLGSQTGNKYENYSTGYNVLTEKFEDFEFTGIIDPAYVVYQALENATSVALNLALTEVTINMSEQTPILGTNQDNAFDQPEN